MKASLIPLFLLSFASTLSAAPVIKADPARDEIGDIVWGSVCERVFTIRNTGDEPLVLSRVRACCGSETSITRLEIPAGESAELRVRLVTRGKPGPIRRAAFIDSNDPATPELRIPLIGNLLPPEGDVQATVPSDRDNLELPAAVLPAGVEVFPTALVLAADAGPVSPRIVRVRLADPSKTLEEAIVPASAEASIAKAAASGEWLVTVTNLDPAGLSSDAALVLRIGESTAAIPIRLASALRP